MNCFVHSVWNHVQVLSIFFLQSIGKNPMYRNCCRGLDSVFLRGFFKPPKRKGHNLLHILSEWLQTLNAAAFCETEDPKPFAPRLRLPQQVASAGGPQLDETPRITVGLQRWGMRGLQQMVSLWCCLVF